MKTFFTLISLSLLVFLFTPTINAQVFEWAESIRGTVDCMSITSDNEGSTYVTGKFSGTAYFGTLEITSSSSSDDIFIAKYDKYGNCLWTKRAGGSTAGDAGNGIAIDEMGNSYITGYFYGTSSFGDLTLTSAGIYDIFIAKYDATGSCVWVNRLGGTSSDYGNAIAVDDLGYVVVTGEYSADIVIARYSSSGAFQWSRTAGGTLGDAGNGVISKSGSIFITGSFSGAATFGTLSLTSSGGTDIFVAKYDNSGNCIWAKRAGASNSDAGFSITQSDDGGVYFTGSFYGTATFGTISLTSYGATDIFVAKYDASGNCLWAKKAGGTSNDYGYGIASDRSGNCYITGNFRGTSYFGDLSILSLGGTDIFIAKYDKTGKFIWVKKAGYGLDDNARSITKSNSGGLYISGKGSGYFGNYYINGSGLLAKLRSFDFDLKIKNNSTDSLTLQFGLKNLATDGLDILLGENSLPPLPPTNVFDARFELPIAPIDYSLSDFRSDTLSNAIWTVKIQAGDGGYPVTISWDSVALGAGSYYLKDPFTGTIVNVDMKNQSSYLLTNNAINTLKIEYNGFITAAGNIDVKAGWNIVSVPLLTNDMSKNTIFANSNSNLYGFANNYQITDTAKNSKGYWIRYPNNDTIEIFGKRVSSLSVPILSGWNLIGIYDRDALVSNITTTPTNILTSLFYGFDNNYQIPTVLASGKGYWIRSSSNGVINLNTNKFAKETEENIVDANWPKIIVKDNLNNEGTLFISENNVNLTIFDLPPVPPQGIFDVRFSTQRMVENLSNAKIIEVNSGTYPLKIKAIGGSFKLKDIISGEFLNLILENEEEVIIDNPAITKFQIESLEIPLEFRLNQNYPNPFNPSTMITYQIPVSGNVTLKVFDILGREVRTLVNERQEAGSYSVDFNVKALSSGTYFYKITAENFSQVKKMVVLK